MVKDSACVSLCVKRLPWPFFRYMLAFDWPGCKSNFCSRLHWLCAKLYKVCEYSQLSAREKETSSFIVMLSIASEFLSFLHAFRNGDDTLPSYLFEFRVRFCYYFSHFTADRSRPRTRYVCTGSNKFFIRFIFCCLLFRSTSSAVHGGVPFIFCWLLA